MNYLPSGFSFDFHRAEDFEVRPSEPTKIVIRNQYPNAPKGKVIYQRLYKRLPNDLEKDIVKKYFTSKEAAAMLNQTRSSIIYASDELGLKTPLSKRGSRLFTTENIALLRRIFILVQVDGLHYWKIKEMIKEGKL